MYEGVAPVHPATQTWFQSRNLTDDSLDQAVKDPSREVLIYLLVTLAVHPERVPADVTAYLAERFFGHIGATA
jgi:hypothetical protein